MYSINKFIIYIVFTFILVSCSESIQFAGPEVDNRIFIDCWLDTYTGVKAKLSTIGIAGISEPGSPDFHPDIELLLTDDFTGINHTFIFDQTEKTYFIPEHKFLPLADNKYKITVKRNGTGPNSLYSLIIPEKINITGFTFSEYKINKFSDGSFRTECNLHIKISSTPGEAAYFMVAMEGNENAEVSVDRFLSDDSAFRFLNLSKTTLIDASKLNENSLRLKVTASGTSPLEQLNIKLHNLTEQSYRYLIFSEYAERFPEGNFRNPSIAPLSINNASFIASFNASATSSYQFKLR